MRINLKKNIPKLLATLAVGLFVATGGHNTQEVEASQPSTPSGFSTVQRDWGITQYNIHGHTFMYGNNLTTMMSRGDNGHLQWQLGGGNQYGTRARFRDLANGERRIEGTLHVALVGGATDYNNYRMRITPENFSSLSTVRGRSFVDNLYEEGTVAKHTLDARLANGTTQGYLGTIISGRTAGGGSPYANWPSFSNGRLWRNISGATNTPGRIYVRSNTALNAPGGGWSAHTQTTIQNMYGIPVPIPSIDDDPPIVTFSPNSRNWGSSGVSVQASAVDTGTGYRRLRRRIETDGSWGSWSSWQTNTTRNFNFTNDGVYRVQVEAEDWAGNVGRTTSGYYRIDSQPPSPNTPTITNVRHVSGNNYWVRPNDTFNIQTSAFDDQSGVTRHYARLFGDGNDNRVQNNRSNSDNHFNEYRTEGGFTNFLSTTHVRTGWTSQQLFTARANSNSAGRSFEVQSHFRDGANNVSGSFIGSGRYIRVDGTAPTISANLASRGWDNSGVSVNLTYSDADSGVATRQFVWSTSTNTPSSWLSYSGTTSTSTNGTWYLHARAVDNVGYVRTERFGPYRIDMTAPNGTISGNPSSWTNQDITLTFNGTDSGGSGVRRVRRPNGTWVNGSTASQTVNSNGTYTFRVEDNAGNIRDVSTTVNRIDKSTPSGSTSVNTGSWTNGNVTITASGSDSASGIRRIQRPNGTWVNGSSASHTVSSNGTYNFVIEDNAGNTRTVSRTVSNIDKTAPNGSISGNPSNWTNQDVTLTFNGTDSGGSGVRRVRRPNGTWVNGSTASQTVSSNGTYTFRVEDNAGNIRDVSANVNRIDKTAPTGSISGNPSNWTNQDVTLTMNASDSQSGVRRVRQPNGTWVNGSTASQTVSSNGTYTFRIEDVAGNTRDVSATVNRIDKTTPSYTSSDVYDARYVSGNDHWYRPGDSFRVRTIGNDSNSRIMYSYLRLSSGDNDNRAQHNWNGSSGSAVNEFSSGNFTEITSGSRGTYNTTAQYTFNGRVLANAGNRTFNVQYYFRDNAGNNNGYHNTGYRIRTDATAPTITANSGSRGWDNTNATVTLTHSDAQSGIATRQFAWSTSTSTPSSWSNYSSAVTQTNNGTWYLHARAVDNVGHVTTERFGPYRIDKTAPNGTISGNPTSWTNQDVTLSINATDSGGSGVRRIRRPDGTWVNGSSTTHTVGSNGTYTFRIEDNAGNIRDVSAVVNRIDKTRPNGSISGNPTSWTNQNVTLSFNGTDSGGSGVRRVRRPDGTWVNGSSTTFTATSNGTYTFRVEDHAGNTRDVSATVNRIDKAAPNGTISGNPTSWTNQDATLTFAGTDTGGSGVRRVRTPNGTWVNSANVSYTVPSNGTYTFRVEDHAGNTRDVSVTVNRIDKSLPNGSISGNATSWTNQDVTLSFTAVDNGGSGIRRVRRPNGTWVNGASTTHTVSANGTYTFRAEDNAGNIRDFSVTVNRIDKVRPEGSISGNPSNWTNQDVTLSFNATDSGGSGVRRVRRPNGTWVNGSSVSHTVGSNGTYTFRVEDHAGNTRDVSVNVTRIDKTTPAESTISIPK